MDVGLTQMMEFKLGGLFSVERRGRWGSDTANNGRTHVRIFEAQYKG